VTGPEKTPIEAPLDIQACVSRAKQHDQDAAEALIEHFYPRVSSIVRGRISKKISEDDIIQEVFVKAFRKIHQYREKVPFEHWLSRIAVTTSLNAMRGQHIKVELRRSDLSEDEDRALDQIAESDRELDPHQKEAATELLGKLLARLSPKERIAIEMLELQGYTSDEASVILDVAPDALRARVSRARRKLQTYFQQLNQDSPS
jgi:RNA polymerase sigma-70 factor (ECF subfamily)